MTANDLIGIETESFLLDHKKAPTSERLKDAFNRFSTLDPRYYRRSDGKRGFDVLSRETNTGYIKIYPDFSSSILEVSYPPISDPLELRDLYEETELLLNAGSKSIDLERKLIGFMPLEIDETVLLKRHHLFTWYKKRSISPSKALAHKYFTARIAALHVHLKKSVVPPINMYWAEYFAPAIFSNSITPQFHCARALSWLNNRPKNFPLWGFPSNEPSVEKVRDYSFIAPRNFGTIEFRSMCTQPSWTRIAAAIGFRLIQSSINYSRPLNQCEQDFRQAALTGNFPTYFETDKNRILAHTNSLHDEFKKPLLAILTDQQQKGCDR